MVGVTMDVVAAAVEKGNVPAHVGWGLMRACVYLHVDPIALWGSASRSSIFLGRIDPRVLLTAKGGEREQRDARSAHAGA